MNWKRKVPLYMPLYCIRAEEEGGFAVTKSHFHRALPGLLLRVGILTCSCSGHAAVKEDALAPQGSLGREGWLVRRQARPPAPPVDLRGKMPPAAPLGGVCYAHRFSPFGHGKLPFLFMRNFRCAAAFCSQTRCMVCYEGQAEQSRASSNLKQQ